MRFGFIRQWLTRFWSEHPIGPNTYLAAFSTDDGARVLNHLVDNVYCHIYEGSDPIKMAMEAGRRSVIHEILENIEMAKKPNKFTVKVETNHGMAELTP